MEHMGVVSGYGCKMYKASSYYLSLHLVSSVFGSIIPIFDHFTKQFSFVRNDSFVQFSNN